MEIDGRYLQRSVHLFEDAREHLFVRLAWGSGCGVWGLGFGVWGLGLGGWGCGVGV